MWLFYHFDFEKNYDDLKSKRPCNLLNKNINCNENETESKKENPTHSFRETNLVLQLIWETQIKGKTVMKEKILIFVLPQCIVDWIHLQNTHTFTFTYQKTLLHTLFCLILKSQKAFSVSLNFSLKPFDFFNLLHCIILLMIF